MATEGDSEDAQLKHQNFKPQRLEDVAKVWSLFQDTDSPSDTNSQSAGVWELVKSPQYDHVCVVSAKPFNASSFMYNCP